jgi:hypothetical protein
MYAFGFIVPKNEEKAYLRGRVFSLVAVSLVYVWVKELLTLIKIQKNEA